MVGQSDLCTHARETCYKHRPSEKRIPEILNFNRRTRSYSLGHTPDSMLTEILGAERQKDLNVATATVPEGFEQRLRGQGLRVVRPLLRAVYLAACNAIERPSPREPPQSSQSAPVGSPFAPSN